MHTLVDISYFGSNVVYVQIDWIIYILMKGSHMLKKLGLIIVLASSGFAGCGNTGPSALDPNNPASTIPATAPIGDSIGLQSGGMLGIRTGRDLTKDEYISVSIVQDTPGFMEEKASDPLDGHCTDPKKVVFPDSKTDSAVFSNFQKAGPGHSFSFSFTPDQLKKFHTGEACLSYFYFYGFTIYSHSFPITITND